MVDQRAGLQAMHGQVRVARRLCADCIVPTQGAHLRFGPLWGGHGAHIKPLPGTLIEVKAVATDASICERRRLIVAPPFAPIRAVSIDFQGLPAPRS